MYLYTLVSKDEKMFKVGITSALSRRFVSLNNKWGINIDKSDLFQLSTYKELRRVERSVHLHLADYNVKTEQGKDGYTEWFDITVHQNLLANLKNNPSRFGVEKILNLEDTRLSKYLDFEACRIDKQTGKKIRKKREYVGPVKNHKGIYEAAALLDKIPQTVLNYARKGIIPCKKEGKFYIFNPKEIKQWIIDKENERIRMLAEYHAKLNNEYWGKFKLEYEKFKHSISYVRKDGDKYYIVAEKGVKTNITNYARFVSEKEHWNLSWGYTGGPEGVIMPINITPLDKLKQLPQFEVICGEISKWWDELLKTYEIREY